MNFQPVLPTEQTVIQRQPGINMVWVHIRGKGHWDSPYGWWYVHENGEKHHSYGNRAYMPMYHSEEAIILSIRQIAKEVFSSRIYLTEMNDA